MEFGSIERDVYIDASPEVVFAVVTRPEHVERWWPDEARYDVAPGATGEIVFGGGDDGGSVVAFAVVDVVAPTRFSFRWTHPTGEPAAVGNSLLVTFELTASGAGTMLRMTETGFREMGWDVAKLEEQYRDHVRGWGIFLPRIAPLVSSLDVRP